MIELDAELINHGEVFLEGPGTGFSGRSTIFNHGLFVMSDPAPSLFSYSLRNFGQVRVEDTVVGATLTPNYGTVYATNSTFLF